MEFGVAAIIFNSIVRRLGKQVGLIATPYQMAGSQYSMESFELMPQNGMLSLESIVEPFIAVTAV